MPLCPRACTLLQGGGGGGVFWTFQDILNITCTGGHTRSKSLAIAPNIVDSLTSAGLGPNSIQPVAGATIDSANRSVTIIPREAQYAQLVDTLTPCEQWTGNKAVGGWGPLVASSAFILEVRAVLGGPGQGGGGGL